jgi:hypothetical protein
VPPFSQLGVRLHSSWLRSEELYHGSVSGFGDKAYLSGFTRGLSELGWTDGRNLRMDVRWAAGSVDRARIYAKELVNVQPDAIVANSTPSDRCASAGDADDPDRIYGRRRPGRR